MPPRRKKLNVVTVQLPQGGIAIHPVTAVDVPDVAAALLAAAANPDEIRTITSPMGWVTSERVARAAGAL